MVFGDVLAAAASEEEAKRLGPIGRRQALHCLRLVVCGQPLDPALAKAGIARCQLKQLRKAMKGYSNIQLLTLVCKGRQPDGGAGEVSSPDSGDEDGNTSKAMLCLPWRPGKRRTKRVSADQLAIQEAGPRLGSLRPVKRARR